jgi:DNA-directed RNA polymerase subunit M/transcription elongation factor TFIIS
MYLCNICGERLLLQEKKKVYLLCKKCGTYKLYSKKQILKYSNFFLNYKSFSTNQWRRENEKYLNQPLSINFRCEICFSKISSYFLLETYSQVNIILKCFNCLTTHKKSRKKSL